MKKTYNYLLLIALLLISNSCTKHDSKPSDTNSPSTPVSSSWVVGEGQVNGNIDFGIVSVNQVKLMSLIIKNEGSSSINSLPIVTGEFQIVYQNGCESLNPGQSCLIKIVFNGQGKVGGVYTGDISFGSYSGILSAVVDAQPMEQDLSVQVNSNELTDALEFGSVNHKDTVIKTIIVKNNSPVSADAPVSVDSNDYEIVYDNCSYQSLRSKNSCVVKVILSARGKNGSVSGVLSVGEKALSLNAQVQGQSESRETNSQLVAIIDAQSVNSNMSIDLGTLNKDSRILKNLFLKNIGSDQTPPLSVNVNSGNLLINQCQNYQLSPNQTCRIQYSIPTSNKGFNQLEFNVLGYQDTKNFNLEYMVRTPGDKIDCTNNMPGVALAQITWSGDSYSSCQVVDCLADYHLSNNSCVSNQQSCPVDNGTGLSFWNGASFGACETQTCNLNYHKVNNDCAPDIISCSAPYALSAQQTWLGSQFSECTILNCQPEYHLNNNLCESNVISCTKPNALVATQTWSGNAYGACTVQTCKSDYHLFNNNCDANIISCSADNALVATQTWTGTNYGQCSITSCQPNYHLTNNQCLIDTFNINIAQPTKGTLTGPSVVNYGASATISYTPVAGYKILAWGGDCVGTDPNSSCVINNVTSVKNVSVSIDTLPYSISSSYSPYTTTAIQVNQCSPVAVSVKDVSGANLNRAVNSTLNLTATSDMQFYSDSICSIPITSTVITSGTNSKTFYVKNKASFSVGNKTLTYASADSSATLSDTRNLVRPTSCLDAKNKRFYNNAGANFQSGYYSIDPTGTNPFTVYCDQSTDTGGWTLVAFNNGNSGKANVPSDFFVMTINSGNMGNISLSPASSSLNVETMSSWLGSTDVMLVAAAYSASPIIEKGIGQWNYNSTKCSGTLRHTSRTAGCSGQNANDDFGSADRFNIGINAGQEGIVPYWLNANNELCYSNKGWCNFQFFIR